MYKILIKLLNDENGQATLEYLVLMIGGMLFGYILFEAVGQLAKVQHSDVQQELSRPSHHIRIH